MLSLYVDENFFAGYALAPYNATTAGIISNNVTHYLSLAGYQGNDRREALFHHNTVSIPPLGTNNTTIEGSPPACPAQTAFWIVTELPDPSRPLANYTSSVNLFVPVILEEYMSGNIAKAQADFITLTSMWDGMGFSSSHTSTKHYSRDLAYYLFAMRATGFSSAIASAVENRLWSLQRTDGTLWVTYDLSGVGFGHTSNEINNLALLDYEVYRWW